MKMSWIIAISQLYRQIINPFGNAILKLIHIRLFYLLKRCHYILNPPRSKFCLYFGSTCISIQNLIKIFHTFQELYVFSLTADGQTHTAIIVLTCGFNN